MLLLSALAGIAAAALCVASTFRGNLVLLGTRQTLQGIGWEAGSVFLLLTDYGLGTNDLVIGPSWPAAYPPTNQRRPWHYLGFGVRIIKWPPGTTVGIDGRRTVELLQGGVSRTFFAPLWPIAVIGLTVPVVSLRRRWRDESRRRNRQCLHCGYDLRATLDPRCPECGGAIADGHASPAVG